MLRLFTLQNIPIQIHVKDEYHRIVPRMKEASWDLQILVFSFGNPSLVGGFNPFAKY